MGEKLEKQAVSDQQCLMEIANDSPCTRKKEKQPSGARGEKNSVLMQSATSGRYHRGLSLNKRRL